jgi:hypothetical protein
VRRSGAWRRLPALCIALSGAVQASTPEAWATHNRQVIDSCLAASGLLQPRAAGELVEFDDSVGYTALLVFGRYPQPHMHKRGARVLCLFDKRTGRASVSPADGIVARPAAAPPTPAPK